jgi:hypothetical protein
MDSHCRGLECRPGSDGPRRAALVARDGPVSGAIGKQEAHEGARRRLTPGYFQSTQYPESR